MVVLLRALTKLINEPKQSNYTHSKNPLNFENIFVFDTETTINEFQNLKIGYFRIYIKGVLNFEGLFYDDENINEKELKIFSNYSKRNKIKIYNKIEFLKQIFYPICYHGKFLCLGYNLPFDISRIALSFGNARGNYRKGFSFKIHENKLKARIRIKKLTGQSSLISFGNTIKPKNNFKGYFIDVQTLACIFTDNKKLSLEKACELFNTKTKKKESLEHGKITPSYIDYLIDDVKSTYEVYEKIVEEYKKYNINQSLTKIYSSASLGKALFEDLGIEKFNDLNPDFSNKILGNVMSAYYGGRCECKLRKTPMKVDVLDFTSMYPSLTLLMGLWDFIIAKEIKYKDVTNEIKDLLNNISIDDLKNKKIWKQFNVLVEIVPNNEILPVRSNYNPDSKIPNISISKFSSDKTFYYALSDLIASKLLSGEIPEIKNAIRFYPNGKQENLKSVKLFESEIDVNKDNLILRLVEERQKIKNSKDLKLQSKQKALKILVNSVAYGIFIEVNPEDKRKDLEVFGNLSFECQGFYEKSGKYYNPIIALMQTSGARLFLAICETLVKNKGLSHYYMDTDSCFVPPQISDELIDYFQDLSPYESNVPLLKRERKNVWFYGISSKRYILYSIVYNKKENVKSIVYNKLKTTNTLYYTSTGIINPIDYKLHGLGHITNPFNPNNDKWHKEIWLDILKLYYGFINNIDLYNKYSDLFVISKISASNPNIMKRFNYMNKYRPINEQIKPYNFLLVGVGMDSEVKPCTSFSKNPQSKVYDEFINYKTAKKMVGIQYWKPLYNEIINYIDHPEHKMDGDIGLLERKKIKDNNIKFIGKEVNDLENESLNQLFIQNFQNLKELKNYILLLTPKTARDIGINQRSSLKKIKDKIRNKEKFNINSKNIRLIINSLKGLNIQ